MTAAVAFAPFALSTDAPIEWRLVTTLLLLVAALGPFGYLSTSWIAYSLGSGAYIAAITVFWLPDEKYGTSIIAAAFLLWAVLIASARANSNIFAQSFLIRHENERLVEHLKQAERTAIENERDTRALKEEALEARAIAEQANIEKSKFIATTSHDLRQPLFAISLHLGVLKANPQLPIDAKSTLAKLENSLQSIDGMLAGLLELASIKAKPLRIERTIFQWRELQDRITDEFTIQTTAKGLKMHSISERIEIYSDPLLLERVIRNILNNAIRHTKEGEIRLVSRSTPSGLEIEISDDGPGIPDEAKARIFDEFFQGSSNANDAAGTMGLGLAISKTICDALNHKLTLVSSESTGAKFKILINGDALRTQYRIRTDANPLN